MYRWELDGPAQREFADLSPAVPVSLAAFMDAVVISLHFGPDGEGLVTFLVYPPDDLVLVVKIQWLGG